MKSKILFGTVLFLCLICGGCNDGDSDPDPDTAISWDETVAHCSNAAIDTCDADPLCRIVEASMYKEGNDCVVESLKIAGCVPLEIVCNQMFYFAEDEENNCWMFPSSCIPSTFNASSDAAKSCEEKITTQILCK